MAAWKRPNRPCKTLFGGQYDMGPLLDDIASVDFVVAHNTKFELGWLRRCGLDLSTVLPFCTMLAEYTIRSNRNWPIDLDSCLSRRGLGGKMNKVSLMIRGGVPPEDIPKYWLEEYGKQDVIVTEELFRKQIVELASLGLEAVNYTRNIITPVLADMEFQGLTLDTDRVTTYTEKVRSKYWDIDQELKKIMGDINPNSPKQMAEFLYNKMKFPVPVGPSGNELLTPSGNRPTGADVLANLKAKTKAQKEFITLKLEHSSLNAELTKALNKFEDCCRDANGTLYASFNQTITNTGRLSSTGKAPYNVQIQNLKREHKPLFRGREDKVLGESDEAQLEFRTAGILSKDERIAQDITERIDVHSVTSGVLTESGQPTDRQGAKAHTFKPLYGGQSGTTAERAYYEHFRQKYSTLTEVQDTWVEQALKEKKTAAPTGLIYYWPHIHITKSGYIDGHTKVRNYPIQYFATGEIVLIGLVYAWHLIKLLDTSIVILNTVHDSIISELYEKDKETYEVIMSYALEQAPIDYCKYLYNIDIDIPLEAETKTNVFWSDSPKWQEEYL